MNAHTGTHTGASSCRPHFSSTHIHITRSFLLCSLPSCLGQAPVCYPAVCSHWKRRNMTQRDTMAVEKNWNRQSTLLCVCGRLCVCVCVGLCWLIMKRTSAVLIIYTDGRMQTWIWAHKTLLFIHNACFTGVFTGVISVNTFYAQVLLRH